MSTPSIVQAGEKPFPAGFQVPVWIIPIALLVVVGTSWFFSLPSIDPFDLPRPGHSAQALVDKVGDWVEGEKGYLGLKMKVNGEGLKDDQKLRFTEGSERVHALVHIHWLDTKGNALGQDFDKPFKDDC